MTEGCQGGAPGGCSNCRGLVHGPGRALVLSATVGVTKSLDLDTIERGLDKGVTERRSAQLMKQDTRAW